MDDVEKAQVTSAIRTLLAVLSGGLITKGVIDEATATAVIGFITAVLPLVWGIVEKKVSERKTREREAAAYAAGTTTTIITTK